MHRPKLKKRLPSIYSVYNNIFQSIQLSTDVFHKLHKIIIIIIIILKLHNYFVM